MVITLGAGEGTDPVCRGGTWAQRPPFLHLRHDWTELVDRSCQYTDSSQCSLALSLSLSLSHTHRFGLTVIVGVREMHDGSPSCLPGENTDAPEPFGVAWSIVKSVAKAEGIYIRPSTSCRLNPPVAQQHQLCAT